MAYDKLVLISDYGNLNTFTAYAEGIVSGGYLVNGTSTNINVVGSDASTYAWSDIHVANTAVTTAVGVALQDTADSGAVAVLNRGVVILPVGSNPVTAGSAVMSTGWSSTVETCPDESGAKIIGRALTTGSHASVLTVFALVSLNI